jgi:penicillin-binding protein 1C
LSWGEAAALAVLPNNPSGIFPGNNQKTLIKKRDALLDKICAKGYFSLKELRLYKAETIPTIIKALPNHTPHLLQRAITEGMSGKSIETTLDYELQKKTTAVVKKHNAVMSLSQIDNAAALILEVKTGNVLAYVGNTATQEDHGKYVDIITANRSPGSLLKPLLYAAALDEGLILPQQLLQDVPIYYNGFIPKNFDRKFRGVVSADKALSSSLNVPFVHLLVKYDYKRFYHLLKKIGYTNLKHPPDHYGLSLILGTADTSLWGLTAVYAGLARAYLAYHQRPLNSGYSRSDYHSNNYLKKSVKRTKESLGNNGVLSAEAIEASFKAMQQLKRPEQEAGWESFLSKKKIAWKTGTSYGFKDAWAIGVNSKYVVGVWVGNADGEPRSDLVGVRAAAPLLFDLFRLLDGTSIVQNATMGSPELVCSLSGMLAKEACEPKVLQELTDDFVLKAKTCTYHISLKLNQEETHQVDSNCHSVFDMITKDFFVLTPIQSWFYKKQHPNHELPPPFLNSCKEKIVLSKIEILYPQKNATISIPREQGGKQGKVVFQAAHQNPNGKVYWHLDHTFVGVTEENHQISLSASAGKHILTLVDNFGNEIQRTFNVIESKP